MRCGKVSILSGWKLYFKRPDKTTGILDGINGTIILGGETMQTTTQHYSKGMKLLEGCMESMFHTVILGGNYRTILQ
jgi:hypothetical protein